MKKLEIKGLTHKHSECALAKAKESFNPNLDGVEWIVVIEKRMLGYQPSVQVIKDSQYINAHSVLHYEILSRMVNSLAYTNCLQIFSLWRYDSWNYDPMAHFECQEHIVVDQLG